MTDSPAVIAVISPTGSICVCIDGLERPIGHLSDDADAVDWADDADAQLLHSGWKRTAEWDGDWAPIERVAATPSPTDAARTIVFPHIVAKRHAELAIDRQAEILDRDRRLATLLKLNSSHDGRVNHVIELGEDCYIVELAGFWAHKDGPSWKVVLGGVAEHLMHLSLDMALLRAVELRNMAMGDDFSGRGFGYAARMLNVPQEG